jgi:hypothetical protein
LSGTKTGLWIALFVDVNVLIQLEKFKIPGVKKLRFSTSESLLQAAENARGKPLSLSG